MKTVIHKAARRLRHEPFFLIALAATLVISIFYRPHFGAVRWSVISILLAQMLVCAAFEECALLKSLAGWIVGVFGTPKKLGLAMVLFSGFLSMLVTNDIALLTVVPVTLSISKLTGRGPHLLVVLETVSANLFSALTPFGNPQNLYLYTWYDIPPSSFITLMLPFGLASVVMLCAAVPLLCRGGCYSAEKTVFEVKNPRLLASALAVFTVNILAVLHVLEWYVSLIAAVAVFLFLAPRLFKKVDIVLLLTFVLFFLFTDALTAIPAVRSFFGGLLSTRLSVLLTAAGLSQVISNVPAAAVLAGFTPHYRELLYGVSAGGLGTLIASLASLISYKLYINEFSSEKRAYLRVFYLVNAAFLILLLLVLALIVLM